MVFLEIKGKNSFYCIRKSTCNFKPLKYNENVWEIIREERKEDAMSTLLNTNIYDYIRVLDKAADASWIRNDCISNNMANVNTPGYKRQDVDFKGQLKEAMGQFRYMTTDEKVHNLRNEDLKPLSYIDYAGFSYRKDENNVDIDVENVYEAENQIYYNGLVTAITSDFQNLAAVTK